MVKFLQGFVFLLFLLLLAGCATTSLDRARNQFYQGRTSDASEFAQGKTAGKQGKDALLYLLEWGLIHHAAGEYEKSNTALLAAAELAEQLEIIQPAKETAALLINDRLLPYKGEPFEKTLIHTYSAINFLHLRQWEDALVECKRALRRLEESERNQQKQPFTHYLAALNYELMGDDDDARIEYEKVEKSLSGVNFVKDDLRRVRKETGQGDASTKGKFICFIGIGKSPVKRSAEIFLPPDKRFVFPVYRKRRSKASHAEIFVDGSCAGRSYLLTDIETLAIDTLKEKTARHIMRASARLVTKEQVARKIEKKVSQDAGNLSRLLFFLTERADTRSWQTLPASLHMARIPADSGRHQVSIRFVTRGGKTVGRKDFEDLEIREGEPVFLSARAF